MEAYERSLLGQAQHRFGDTLDLRLAFHRVFRQMSGFLALVNDNIADTILIIGQDADSVWLDVVERELFGSPVVDLGADRGQLKIGMLLTVEIDFKAGEVVLEVRVLHRYNRVELHARFVHGHESGEVREQICIALVKAVHFGHVEALAGELCHCLADD